MDVEVALQAQLEEMVRNVTGRHVGRDPRDVSHHRVASGPISADVEPSAAKRVPRRGGSGGCGVGDADVRAPDDEAPWRNGIGRYGHNPTAGGATNSEG